MPLAMLFSCYSPSVPSRSRANGSIKGSSPEGSAMASSAPFLCRIQHNCVRPESNHHFVASLICSLFLFALCFPGAVAISVNVDHSSGADSTSCGAVISPCKSIEYAIHSRRATDVHLVRETFFEPTVYVNSSVVITGSGETTVFDCSGAGPALVARKTTVSLSGITFKNCANFKVLNGFGGALSADLSVVTVANCSFLNNTAQTGGAIGSTSTSVTVLSSFFQNNIATCSSADAACSAWGGAIGIEEAHSVTLNDNSFFDNSVNLRSSAASDPTSHAVGGGGCVSVLFNVHVVTSSVNIDTNIFDRCLVQNSGRDSQDHVTAPGLQHASAYGGAVSVYYGRRAALHLEVRNAAASFSSNICRNSRIMLNVGTGGSSFGGCLSVYAGVQNATFQAIAGNMSVNSAILNISRNQLLNCSASLEGAKGVSAYGGGMSIALGAYSYNFGSSSDILPLPFVSGSTEVNNIVYIISSNTLCSCSAMTSTLDQDSFGSIAYGGGISLVIGAYSYSQSSMQRDSSVSGSTAVNSSTISISNNMFSSCVSQSSTLGGDSYGAIAYGGGMSLVVGAYSYSQSYYGSKSSIFGSTAVSNSTCSIFSNNLSSCITSTKTSNNFYGVVTRGGGMSLVIGAYSYSQSYYGSKDYGSNSSIFGSTAVISSTFTVVTNLLSGCVSSSTHIGNSFGAIAYGGSLSSVVGVYSYSYAAMFSSDSSVSGSTAVSNSTYNIFSNKQSNCSAVLAAINRDGASYGAIAYGGGMSLVVGAYSYSYVLYIGSSVSSISGNTAVSDINYTIFGNTFSSCSALSSTTGAPSFGSIACGGCVMVLFGAYSYSYGAAQSSSESSVSGSTAVNSSTISISNNMFSSCVSQSSTLGGDSYGAIAYGGGMSLVVGAFSKSHNTADVHCASFISGSTAASNSAYTISSNTLSNCNAICSLGSTVFGANTFGGGISFVIGAYSYSQSETQSTSSVFGSTTASNGTFSIFSNKLFNCSSDLSTLDGNSHMAIAYGGGMSLVVGSYSYSYVLYIGSSGVGGSFISGNLLVSAYHVQASNSSFQRCKVVSSFESSQDTRSYGGAVAIVYEAFEFPQNRSKSGLATVQSSYVGINFTNFSDCSCSSQSSTCASGSVDALGGAVLLSVPNCTVTAVANIFTNSSVEALGAAPSSLSRAQCLGGGLSVIHAGSVAVKSSHFLNCRARGIVEANNVRVSGGGVYVQGSQSLTLESTSVASSSVAHALSPAFLLSGGGALCSHNVPLVILSDSAFFNNSDSSLTAVVFMLQQCMECGMLVNITNGSILSTSPSISTTLPALNISCGFNCSLEQQTRITLSIINSTVLAQSAENQFRSASVLSIPRWLLVSAMNSFVNCTFRGTDALAVHSANNSDDAIFSVYCAPCDKPFEIALTSSRLNLADFSSVRQQVSCRSMNLKSGSSSSVQRCPYGISYCSTIVTVTEGFWANFTADGSVGDAIMCPANYCGCPSSSNTTGCRLHPMFSPEFQKLGTDALCKHHRTGTLCGGCEFGFTQSLNGYSCISNEVCQRNMGWVWAVAVLGYFIYSVYIVRSSFKRKSGGLIMCLLFYGQMSSFATMPYLDSAGSTWFSKLAQVQSIPTLFEQTCYGVSMGAYAATVARLSGPAIVVFSSALLIFAVNLLQFTSPQFLQKCGLDSQVSFIAAMTSALLFLFSSVCSVVFQLITCQDIGSKSVLFIDGTVSCAGPMHTLLIAVAALFCVLPILFWLALKFDKVPAGTRAVVCRAYVDARYYWVAVTLLFRFAITTLHASLRQSPSISAVAMSVCALGMLLLLITSRPYVVPRTYYVDAICHVCLNIQFLLQAVAQASLSSGVSVAENGAYLQFIANAGAVLRYATIFHLCTSQPPSELIFIN